MERERRSKKYNERGKEKQANTKKDKGKEQSEIVMQ